MMKFFLAIFIFISLESSETHFDLVASKTGAKLYFSSKFFVEKFRKSQTLKMKILLNEKNAK